MSIELVFTSHGTAELRSTQGEDDPAPEVLWSSDADADFTDEFPDEFLGEKDADDVLDYLTEAGHLGEDVEVDVFEESLSDDELAGAHDD